MHARWRELLQGH